MTFPYYRFYRQNTLLPILRLAKGVEDRDGADLISQRLHQWQTRKLDEYRFVQLSVCKFSSAVLSPVSNRSFQGSLLAAAVIGSFSWPIPDTIHWLGPASWYASLIMSFCAVLLSSSEHFLYAATRDHAQHADLRRRLNMVVRIRGGGPGDLLLSTAPSRVPAAQPQQPAQGMAGPARGQGSATPAIPLRAEVRWNMVFTWQAPMMLLSYSLIAFVMGLSLCVLTPLYDGRDSDDACKVRGFLFLRPLALVPYKLLSFYPHRLLYFTLSFQSSQGQYHTFPVPDSRLSSCRASPRATL